MDEHVPFIRNFRQAASLPGIYRCGMAEFDGSIRSSHVDREFPEHILLQRAGLILDLRSPSERNEAKAKAWMEVAPGGRLIVKDFVATKGEHSETSGCISADAPDRTVLRIDVLSSKRLFNHLTEYWLSPSQRALANTFSSSGDELHGLRTAVLNERGLPGLYEAIIKTSGAELLCALQSITYYFEGASGTSGREATAVIHCVQGKDRTGLLVMLCQAIIGLSDKDIVMDYSLSNTMIVNTKSGSAAADKIGMSSSTSVRRGKLDWKVFSGAPPEAMEATLAMIRADYGSISPGYLDAIGFDEQWRRRFLNLFGRVRNGIFVSSRL